MKLHQACTSLCMASTAVRKIQMTNNKLTLIYDAEEISDADDCDPSSSQPNGICCGDPVVSHFPLVPFPHLFISRH